MDRGRVIKVATDYANRVKSIINPKDIILYGSYCKGTENANSDIDIAVVFDEFDGDYWKTIQKLHELTMYVDTRIEPVLLEDGNDPSGFVKAIRLEGLKVS